MIRYTGPVIDTHHHIWLRKDVAWLKDPPIRRAIGDFFNMRRDIPVEEWMHDVVPQGVVKSVHVTGNWGPDRALDETRWLQSIADLHGFPHAIVCQADLADPDVETKLKAQKGFPNLRGVRHQLHWASEPLRQNVSRPDLCNTAEFRRGFALLEKYDLHFELQVFAAQATYARELIKAFPNTRFILLHAGMLTDRTPAVIEQWRAALTVMAEYPNVHVKISGLNMFNPDWTQNTCASRFATRFKSSASSARSTEATFRLRSYTQAIRISLPHTATYFQNIRKRISAGYYTTMQ